MSSISVEIFEFKKPSVISTYKKVWSDALCPNPFISPNILERIVRKNIAVQVAFFYQNDKIIGAMPFTMTCGCLQMVGESMSDSIELLFVSDIAIRQKYEAICSLIQKLAPSNLVFKKLCDVNLYPLLFVKALREFDYKYFYVESWKNLFVKYESPQFDSAIFLKNFNKGNTRNYSNKFKKEQNYSVKVIRQFNAEAIHDWMEFFFMYHELRWSQTNTPSVYSAQAERDELEAKVSAWMADSSCILFSLNVSDKPVSMSICLTNNKSIIYHQIAYKATKEILKYRINKLLIFELSRWMVENHFEILDFGVGNEPYKYEYTQNEKRIIRLYASNSVFSKFYFKGFFDYHYQRNPKFQKLLNNYLRVYVTKVKSSISFIKSKLLPVFQLIKSDKKLLLKKIKRKLAKEIQIFYQFRAKQIRGILNDSLSIKLASCYEIIRFYEEEFELTKQKRLFYLRKIEEGQVIPYVIVNNQSMVLSIAWKTIPNEIETPANLELNNPIVIIDCLTAKVQRGKGYYHLLIQHIALNHQGDTLIYTNDWNIASQKGILKAGFVPVAKRLKTNSKTYEWQ